MRILFLTDCYLPHAGGARVYYHNLYRELVRNADNHVTILTSKVPGWQAFDRMERGERLRTGRIGPPAGRIRTISPGVDCVRFQPNPPPRDLIERHGLQGKKVILTVGRLVPRKGHRMVLAAMRKLLPVMPDLVYVIVGTGSEQEALRNIAAEWNLTGSVRFAGYVKDADLPAYYNACDLYVMPNSEENGDLEGFGMVFTEANACGKA